MKDREKKLLEAYLDGEIRFQDLPEEMQAAEARLGRALDRLDDDVRAPAGFREEVMREIHALPRSRWQDALSWFLRPRTVRFTPATAGGVGLLALLGVLLLPGGNGEVPAGNEVAVAPDAEPAATTVMTRFVFVAPEARSVTLTGDWVGWDAEQIELRELRGSGVWTVDVPVPPGVHEYSFVVDGTEWRPDPLAGSQADDGFGRVNSVLMVSAEA